jgi:hypothetical protein
MEQRKDCDTCANEAKLGIENPCRDCWKGDQWEPKGPEPDNVNHPAHYEGNTSLECIDVMEIAFGADAVGNFCLCNAFKYLWRYKHKGGAEDVQKAEWYLNHFESIMGEYSDVEDGYNKMRELVHVALGETK